MFIVLCGGVCAQDGKANMSMEPKITCSKICSKIIFQPILEFKKQFHYIEANAVKLSTFQ
jgi:hypothetical protein